MSFNSEQRIFVVDDEQVIAWSLAMILRREGFNATCFSHPIEALEASDIDIPQLLITDVVMPRLSGIDLAIQVTHHHPGCKVLLLSGQATSVDLIDDARAHGHPFQLVAKPVHPADLIRTIRSVMAGEPPANPLLEQLPATA